MSQPTDQTPYDPYIHHASPQGILAAVLAGLTIVLSTPPFIWHVRNRNIAAASLVGWIMISNFFNFINAIIWPTDDTTSWYDGVGLCDVEVKLQAAATLGITGALACIMRSLAKVLDTSRTVLTPSRGEKRQQLMMDLLFCFGFPIYIMAIIYVVQENRYYIFAIAGCTPSTVNSWPSIVLVLMWPLLMCLVDVYYCSECSIPPYHSTTKEYLALVIWRIHKYRAEFSSILSASTSFNKSRFLRLFIMALILVVGFFPVEVYIFYRNVAFPFVPYSFKAIHGESWWQVVKVPTFGVETFDRWIQIACGFIIFMFFGFGADATKMYRRWLVKMGFAKLFPHLDETSTSQKRAKPNAANPSSRSRLSSLGSKARLIIGKTMSFSQGSTLVDE